ncbi:hypothetical protein PRBEI_2001173400 [Prionailurus iriomotensis]
MRKANPKEYRLLYKERISELVDVFRNHHNLFEGTKYVAVTLLLLQFDPGQSSPVKESTDSKG